MVESLKVELGARSYPLHFAADASAALANEIAALVRAGRKVALLTDRNVAAHQAGWLARAGLETVPRRVLEPGEGTKSAGELARVWDFMAAERLDRGSVLVVAGGGVIGDLGGFAAASYLRGIGFLQVPTTLLAMVDSSVGGKTGINLGAGKNLVGAFHQPSAVYVSTDLLETLAPREFAAGMAEVIKYGLLGDAELFAQLAERPLRPGDPRLTAVIRRCCALKAAVVQADEFETAPQGGRALLNLGHTFGHAIEQVTGYGAYLHGEAVAVGLVAAAHLSRSLGYIDGAAVAAVEHVVAAHTLPGRLREPLPWEALRAAMGRDKKVRAGALRFVVLRRVGEAATAEAVDPAAVEAAFRAVGAA